MSFSKNLGKTAGSKTYIHISLRDHVDGALSEAVRKAEELASASAGTDYNVLRFDPDLSRVSLLLYRDFFDDPFPALHHSWFVDLAGGRTTYRTYEDSQNPPILHRKELLLPQDHPRRSEYEALTDAAESIGLFDDPTRIGFREQWLRLLLDKGYRLAGHSLVPIANDDSDAPAPDSDLPGNVVARHLTALVRYGFSAPIQSLARHGYLDGRFTVFDYGCGRGDDVRGLLGNGIRAAGWDPHYAPANPIAPADIVNLGFVINVIEDFDERLTALTRAYNLAEQLLVVSVMLANQNVPQGRRLHDGLLTSRGTFQKYYTQSELQAYLAAALDEEPLAIAPGIFYVFRDKDAEQRFLLDRYRSRRNLLRHPASQAPQRHAPPRPDRNAQRYTQYCEPLERLWAQWVALGRKPDALEVKDLPALTEGFGSLPKALRFLQGQKDLQEVAASRSRRTEDIQVYLALQQFQRRKAYRHLERGLQLDIKDFFGDYATANQQGRQLLFCIADTDAVSRACEEAAQRGLGWLDEADSLTLHTSLVQQLPGVLRVYVAAAAALYGDYTQADLVKIHIRSGKLTLMRFDDFAGHPLPRMIERVKIKLREQDLEYYAYGEKYEPPYLYLKSRYINEEFPNYPEQFAFDEALQGLALFDLSRHGPEPEAFRDGLERNRWELSGFQLVRSRAIPDLASPCGRFLTYRELIECGETQARSGLSNLPRQPDSYTALLELASRVLDPLIEYYGKITLTYGFCSPELAKRIKHRIAPNLDQHAAHELRADGTPVCKRLGAAVDFLVTDEDMSEVADWIVSNLDFDRLYYYGRESPLHVSVGPEQKREVVDMTLSVHGKIVPRVTSKLRMQNKCAPET